MTLALATDLLVDVVERLNGEPDLQAVRGLHGARAGPFFATPGGGGGLVRISISPPPFPNGL